MDRIRRLVAVAAFGICSLAGAQEASIPASELMPLEERSKPFLITQGPNRGEEVQVTLSPAQEGEGVWQLSMGDIGSVFLSSTDGGDIVITRIELTETNNRIIYDEPVRLLPATVSPDGVHTETTGAEVIDTKEGTVRQGQVSHQVNPVSHGTFYLPVGEREGFLVEAQQEIEMDMATVTLWLRGGLGRGDGLLYGHVRYTIDKPLGFGSTTEQAMELAE